MNQSDNFDLHVDAWTTTQERNRGSLFSWCDLAAGMQAIRGQWKAPILIALSEAQSDVPALQRRLEQANRRVIVRALRELGEDRLIQKSACSNQYLLTSDGSAVVAILRDIALWHAERRSASA